jgi:hypothetical protein
MIPESPLTGGKSYRMGKAIKILIHLIDNWILMTGLKSVLSQSTSVVTRKTGNEYVLVPITNNIADMNSVYTLNETGAFIWEQINGSRNLEEIITNLTNEYDIDMQEAETDVFDFIENMRRYLIIR